MVMLIRKYHIQMIECLNCFEYKNSEVQNKIPDTSSLVTATVLNTKFSEVENKTPDTSSLVTTTVLNTKISEVENKIPDTSSLVTTTVLSTKISEVDNKILNNSTYVTSQEFNKLTAENFAAIVKQVDLDKLRHKLSVYAEKRDRCSNECKLSFSQFTTVTSCSFYIISFIFHFVFYLLL